MIKAKFSLIFGIISFIIFTFFPFILDFSFPAKKTLAQRARVLEILDTINKTDYVDFRNRNRSITKNILIIVGFICFALAICFSIDGFSNKEKKWYSYITCFFAIIGLAFFLIYLGISTIASIFVTFLILSILGIFALGGGIG